MKRRNWKNAAALQQATQQGRVSAEVWQSKKNGLGVEEMVPGSDQSVFLPSECLAQQSSEYGRQAADGFLMLRIVQ